jgi:hypothetical protein
MANLYIQILIRISTLLIFSMSYSQSNKIEHYRYGYEGIELITKVNDTTIVYTHHLAKPQIRISVGNTILHLYSKGELKDGYLKVIVPEATVFGTIKIKKSGTIIQINFSYSRVEWSNGKIEEPVKK